MGNALFCDQKPGGGGDRTTTSKANDPSSHYDVDEHAMGDETTFDQETAEPTEEGGVGNNNKRSTKGLLHSDPFTPRKGKALVWRNVNMTLASKGSDEPERKLLSNVWGEVPNRETTAVSEKSNVWQGSRWEHL